MMYVRFPLSLRNVEDLLHERGIDISHETVRFWWNRFGPIFAAEIRKRRVQQFRVYPNWQWHLDEVFVGYCQRTSSQSELPQKSILRVIQRRWFFGSPQRTRKLKTRTSDSLWSQEHHLTGRNNFKLNRAAAFAEWRQLGVA